ncbi:MAG: hypothetical protein KDC84_01165 [Crocinitomicaceae bacterium]|nr:hypothetical protein [Crocinitomicaceae bacterium]
MKLILALLIAFTGLQSFGQSQTDELIQCLKLKKGELEKQSNYSKFCPTCELNQAESFMASKTVLQSNHSPEKRSTYYFQYNEDNKIESITIAGFKGLIDEHYKYLTKYGFDNGLISKAQAEEPGSTSFTVAVRGNRFNCKLVKRITSGGTYYFIKFTFIAVPDF